MGGGGEASPFSRAEPPPPVVVAPVAEPPKRGRGRPRKTEVAPSTIPPALSLNPADAAPTATQQVKAFFVDSKRAAATITIALDGALMSLARARYDSDNVDGAAITDAERKELEQAFEAFLKATGTQLSPGAALVVAVGGVYGTRAIGLEVAHRKARASE